MPATVAPAPSPKIYEKLGLPKEAVDATLNQLTFATPHGSGSYKIIAAFASTSPSRPGANGPGRVEQNLAKNRRRIGPKSGLEGCKSRRIRRGEICGLNVGDVSLDEQAITVQRSRWKSKLKRPKNGKKRFFALSPQLAERLRFYVEGRNPDQPLFLSTEGRRLHPDNFIKRQLKPILLRDGDRRSAKLRSHLTFSPYFCVIGGTMPVKRRYSTSCP